MVETQLTREQALDRLAERIANANPEQLAPIDICDWMESRYYLAPGSSTESSLRFSIPIRLMPHQKVILRLQFHHPNYNFVTQMYSTVKKSGKTSVGGGVARYLCENSGFYAEVYCLEALTPITLVDGTRKRILDLVKERYSGEVRCYDTETGCFENKKVVGWHSSSLNGRKWIQLSHEYARIISGSTRRCVWLTEDHPVLTPEGYVPAREIRTGDPIVTDQLKPNHKQMELIFGTVLGDGHIARNSTLGSLRLTHSLKQKEWMQTKIKALTGFSRPSYPSGREEPRYNRIVWESESNGSFSKLHEEFYDLDNKKKAIPIKMIEEYYTEIALAAHYLDDGNRNGKFGTLEVLGYTDEDAIFLCNYLNLNLGINCRPTWLHGQPRIYFPEDGMKTLSKLIGKFVPPSMRYKVSDDAPKYEPSSWDLGKAEPFIDRAIKMHGYAPRTTTVYCIDVEDHHNFVAGPLVVHNCLANDEEQARGRIYKAACDSIENSPSWDDHSKRLLMTPHARARLDQMYGSRASMHDIEWRIIERQAEYIPTKSFLRALSSDYRGEAGANPTATVWSEIWGLDSEKSKKLWAELTPVPTRPSRRFVETYAGYEDESIILEEVWSLAMEGYQLTRQDLADMVSTTGYPLAWPIDEPGYRGHPDKLPIWINEKAQLCAYIDQGVEARRMPWQKGVKGAQYYIEEEQTLEPLQNRRFHENEWTGTTSPFVDLMWWKHCSIREIISSGGLDYTWGNIREGVAPLRSLREPGFKPPLVLACDAAVSNDYMAACLFSREGPHKVALRAVRVWKPEDQPGGKFDFEETLLPFVRSLCAEFNIVEFTYDPFQLHKVATDLERDWTCACFSFNQNQDRMKADKQLHDLIRDRDIVYDPLLDPDLLGDSGLKAFEDALRQCAMRQSKDEDTKYRIIKKGKGKIDPVIAASMGAERTLYLNLW